MTIQNRISYLGDGNIHCLALGNIASLAGRHFSEIRYILHLTYEVLTDTAALPCCHSLFGQHAPTSPTVFALNLTFSSYEVSKPFRKLSTE